MLADKGCRLYESPAMRQLTGETIRPGGYFLTDRAMEFCAMAKGSRVLDVGCGSGATVEYLNRVFQMNAVGIDPSELLLELGRQRDGNFKLVAGVGEDIPFGPQEMDGVLAECTLSLMQDVDKTLQEIARVLKEDGWFVANDVYARNPEGIGDLRKLQMASCLRGAMAKEELLDRLSAKGFSVVLWEDHTDLLKQLAFKQIMSHGSMADFWLKTSACTIDPIEAQAAMAKVKMGYFMLIARKTPRRK